MIPKFPPHPYCWVNGFIFSQISFQTELAEQKKITEDYRAKLIAMESEMQSLRDQAFGKYQDMNHEFSQWHFHPPLSFFSSS